MNLVLVESPTKARTVAKFLGGGYVVEATYGHVRDLPETKLGVEIKKLDSGGMEFKPEYVVGKKQGERMKEIKRLSLEAKNVYLATDPDREGEAIAFHVGKLLETGRGGDAKYRRIVFHEITRGAIEEALKQAGEVNLRLVEAQQARRVMDRLVGYKLSPLLWKKVRRGLSAGRVQSVAVKLIVEREGEIEAFVPEEYWEVYVTLEKLAGAEAGQLVVKLVEMSGEKVRVANGQQAKEVEVDLRGAKYGVKGVERKEFSRTPPAPFTTSTLQQSAANRLGWSAKKTMQVAQGLYEEGFITYHRTDSTNIAAVAARAVAQVIKKTYGGEYGLDRPRFYKTKSRVAQEAHEAIRPTEVGRMPGADTVMGNRDQQKLYEMIWRRFVACQMAEARGVTVKVTVAGVRGEKEYGLEAKGETVTFAGWYKLYPKTENGEAQMQMPEVSEGEELKFMELVSEQKFTQPPPRYNDASLIKTLEEMGIGRPSTYAPIISTILERQYVEREEKRFKPTALGRAVNEFLTTNFAKVVDYGFTAKMEEELDEIANGEKEWQPVVGSFWGPFEADLGRVEETAARVKVAVEATGEKCPKCSEGEVVIRVGRFGKFLACSRYPECDYKANFQNKIGMKCPKCSEGEVIMRKTKSRRSFYGCSRYPECDWASWNKPGPGKEEPKGRNG